MEAVDIYLEDKGSAAYTEYEASEDIMDLFEEHPHLEDCKSAMIHSHVNMSTYFSATDMSELEDNHAQYEMYLSLIVNNRGDTCAKLAFPGVIEVEKTTKKKSIFKFKFNNAWISKLKEEDEDNKEEINVMFVVDVEVDQDDIPEFIEDTFFKDRVEEVIKNASTPKYTQDRWYNDRNNGNGYNNFNWENDHRAAHHVPDKSVAYNEKDDEVDSPRLELGTADFRTFMVYLLTDSKPKPTDTFQGLLQSHSRHYLTPVHLEAFVGKQLEGLEEAIIHTFKRILHPSEIEDVIDQSIGFIKAVRDRRVCVPLCDAIITKFEDLF